LHGKIHHSGSEYLGRLVRQGAQPSQGGIPLRGVLLDSAESRFSIDGANIGDRLGHRRIGSDHERSAGLETILPTLLLPFDLSLAFRGRGGGLGPASLHESGEVWHLTGWLTVRAPDAVLLVEFGRDPVEIPRGATLGIGALHAPHVDRQTRGCFGHPVSTELNEAHLRAVMMCKLDRLLVGTALAQSIVEQPAVIAHRAPPCGELTPRGFYAPGTKND
jgi:hypothetical protein